MTDPITLPITAANLRPDYDYCMVETPKLSPEQAVAPDIYWRLTYYGLEARRSETRNFRTPNFAEVRTALETEEDWHYLGEQDGRHYFQRAVYDHVIVQPDQVDQMQPDRDYLMVWMSGLDRGIEPPQDLGYHENSSWDLTFYHQTGQWKETRYFHFGEAARMIKVFESEGWEYIGEAKRHHYFQRSRDLPKAIVLPGQHDRLDKQFDYCRVIAEKGMWRVLEYAYRGTNQEKEFPSHDKNRPIPDFFSGQGWMLIAEHDGAYYFQRHRNPITAYGLIEDVVKPDQPDKMKPDFLYRRVTVQATGETHDYLAERGFVLVDWIIETYGSGLATQTEKREGNHSGMSADLIVRPITQEGWTYVYTDNTHYYFERLKTESRSTPAEVTAPPVSPVQAQPTPSSVSVSEQATLKGNQGAFFADLTTDAGTKRINTPIATVLEQLQADGWVIREESKRGITLTYQLERYGLR
ncbi:MAG: hypothetical protein MUF87_09970 [Anaerolineae bacterium]|nr:hypothetical protein [Anaerolineae bacterium]